MEKEDKGASNKEKEDHDQGASSKENKDNNQGASSKVKEDNNEESKCSDVEGEYTPGAGEGEGGREEEMELEEEHTGGKKRRHSVIKVLDLGDEDAPYMD